MSEKPLILVVEDSRTEALRMRLVLEKEGWEVCCADNASQAIVEIGRKTPDLILVDYYLPGIRGDELCRQIRMRVDTRVIPIVMLTANETDQIQLQGLESGADDFLPKTFEVDTLLLRLRSLLSKSCARSESNGPTDSYFNSARLLTIDDSATFREYLSKVLSDDGFQVETAASGQEGLDRVEAESFDCVLVDLVMPGMDGIEVCERLNRMRRSTHQSFMLLMLTAREDKQNLTRALEVGADDFVGKSSDAVVVKGRIRALLRRKFYEDEYQQKLLDELKNKELEAAHARAQKEAAEARAALATSLERTASQLRRSNAELQEITHVAHHDLQTPLQSITRSCQLVLEQADGRDVDNYKEQLDLIVQSAKRMKRLLDDLLRFSQVGSDVRRRMPTDCNAVAMRVLEGLGREIEETRANVTVCQLPTLSVNPDEFYVLLWNLIANAIKFRGECPLRVLVQASVRDGEWLFTIRDNGRGIDERKIENLFGIFRRIDRSKEAEGTGIGLALCKKIVECHAGRIWVESKPGVGTTVRFTISSSPSYYGTPPTSNLGEFGRSFESQLAPMGEVR